MNWKSEDLSLMNEITNNKKRIKELEEGAESMKIYRHTIKLYKNGGLSIYFDIFNNVSTAYTSKFDVVDFINGATDIPVTGFWYQDSTYISAMTAKFIKDGQTRKVTIYGFKSSSSNYDIKQSVKELTDDATDGITITDSCSVVL